MQIIDMNVKSIPLNRYSIYQGTIQPILLKVLLNPQSINQSIASQPANQSINRSITSYLLHVKYSICSLQHKRLENGQLSDCYRIRTDTGCNVSNRIGYFCIGRYYVHHCRFSSC